MCKMLEARIPLCVFQNVPSGRHIECREGAARVGLDLRPRGLDLVLSQRGPDWDLSREMSWSDF